MRRCNVAMHSLLETNETNDILCVQEPWFEKIGTACNDKAKEGGDVLGGASHHNWKLFYPYSTHTKHAKVMIYVQKYSRLASKKMPTPHMYCTKTGSCTTQLHYDHGHTHTQRHITHHQLLP